MKKEYRETLRATLVSIWLSAAAFILVMVVTAPRGIGMTTDSVVYFQAARYASFGEGFLGFSRRGELEPLLHYPPLYPAVLALGSYLGLDTFGWARLVNSFLFGLNVFLISILAFYITGRRRSALLAGWLALIFVQMVEIHAIALSEPLFLALTLLALGTLMIYVEKGNRRWLMLSALLAGLSMLTRHGGLAVVVAGVLALGTVSRRNSRGRILELAGFLASALALPLLWAWRNVTLSGRATDLHFGFFPAAVTGFWRGIDTISVFLLPASLPATVRWVALGLFLWALTASVLDLVRDLKGEEGQSRLRTAVTVIGSFLAVYLVGSLLTALLVSDGGIPLDRRILLPLPAALIVLVPALLRRKYFEGISRKIINLRVLLLLLFLGVMFLRTVQLAKSLYQRGYGYSSRAWTETSLVKTVRTLAEEVPVYSNDPQAFYFYAGRPAILIPQDKADVAYFPEADQVRK
ncbi:MAG: glycosyltransferase family 39 protein, partial [Candidatus Omnitrophica bacterium]|nr:glycosyltransferase family 39 protein [Candidatus Omnitrophota bacterium]